MKKIYCFLFGMLLSSIVWAQGSAPIITTSIPSDSISAAFNLTARTIPTAVWSNDISSTTLYIQVGFSSNKNTAPTTWYTLSELSDTTTYSVLVTAGKIIPFDPTIVLNVLGSWGNEASSVWIRYILGEDQSSDIFINTRLRYF